MKLIKIITSTVLVLSVSSCAPKIEEDASSNESGRNLYFASGACYSGNGITTFTNTTSSNVVVKVPLSSPSSASVIADYASVNSIVGDSPVALSFAADGNLLVGVENTTTVGARKIDIVNKDQTDPSASRSAFNQNITALSAQIRSMVRLPDGYLLVSRSTAIEKIRETSSRLLSSTHAWVTPTNPPVTTSCGPSVTLISSVLALPSGQIVFGHAATGQSRVAVVSGGGFLVAGDCRSAVTPAVATSFPTALAYDAENQRLFVAYMGATTADNVNQIISYSVNETTGVLSNPQEIYDSNGFGSTYNFLLFGVSAMTYDSVEKKLYVATSNTTATNIVTSGNYQITKLNYDASLIGTVNTSVLSLDSVLVPSSRDTKCISSMIISN